VYYSKPVVEEVTNFELFTGRMEAEKTVEIRARVTGYLQKILFEDGAEVPADSQLFEIDPRPYKAVLERAEATLAQMKARHRRADADYSRKTALFNRGTISREEYDMTVDEYYESKAAVGVAEADVDSAKLNVSFTTATTPVGGRISRRMVDIGN